MQKEKEEREDECTHLRKERNTIERNRFGYPNLKTQTIRLKDGMAKLKYLKNVLVCYI